LIEVKCGSMCLSRALPATSLYPKLVSCLTVLSCASYFAAIIKKLKCQGDRKLRLDSMANWRSRFDDWYESYHRANHWARLEKDIEEPARFG